MTQALQTAAVTVRHRFRDELRQQAGWIAETATPARPFPLSMQDLKHFLVTYCVCFVGAMAFIA